MPISCAYVGVAQSFGTALIKSGAGDKKGRYSMLLGQVVVAPSGSVQCNQVAVAVADNA